MNDFISAVHTIERHFIETIDFIDQEAYQHAKQKFYVGGIDDLTDDEWLTIIMYGSHVGDVMRTTYYKFIHKRDIDPRAYWDAAIKTFMFGRIWNIGLESAIKDKRIKALIKRTRYPKWTVYGLVGGNWSAIQRDAREFCAYMDALDEATYKEKRR